MKHDDYRGLAIVLDGTNYGEADRIMRVLLETGEQISVMAKAVRKSKSKLAGGAQILAINRLEIHFSKSKNSSILVGAKMVEFFPSILTDFERLRLAYAMLKCIKRAENMINPKFFDIMKQSLQGLGDKNVPTMLTRVWFAVNFDLLVGEINDLYYATDGEKLRSDEIYAWDIDERAFYKSNSGKFDSDDIKYLRFLSENNLRQALLVKDWAILSKKLLDSGIVKSAP